MNLKPTDRQTSPWCIQKLQDFEGLLEGTLVEVSRSKMGSPIYRIRRDFDLVSIYGFKDLDEQMKSIESGSLIRIVYLGSEHTYSGNVRYLAKVEVVDDIAGNSIVESQFESTHSSPTSISQSHRVPTPSIIVGPTSSEASFRFLQKMGILR